MPSISLTTTPLQYMRGYGTAPTAGNDSTMTTLGTAIPTIGTVLVKDSNLTKVLFYGTGAVDSQFYATIYAYSQVSGTTFSTLWIPTLICKLLCTNSATVGVAGTLIVTAERFVDSIALIDGDPTVKIASDIDGRIASVVADMEGATYMCIRFDTTGLSSAATGFNFLYATL